LSVGPFRLPSWFGCLVAWAGRVFFKADFSKVRPFHVVKDIAQPILSIHGADDPVISAEESVELHVVSDNQQDRVWIVPGAEHINVYRKMPKVYVHRVSQFFQRHIV
jgi:fermentation-respiration switch protein FrsA (DUF1100 family)